MAPGGATLTLGRPARATPPRRAPTDRVGFIGLGLIGLPIARRLLERGHPVVATGGLSVMVGGDAAVLERVRLLLPTLAQQCYQEARGLGHGRGDMSAVIRPMGRIAGVQVRSKEP